MIPPKHFYMIRHGETEGNFAKICTGQTDGPLTDKGRTEAAAVIAIVDALTLAPIAVYHSHLSRARYTATILNQNLGVPLYENSNVAERHFGDWHGMAYADMDALRDAGHEPPNGETTQQFYTRVATGITDILNAHDAPVIIACHGGVFMALGALYGVDFGHVKNCVLYEFVPNDNTTGLPWDIYQYSYADGKILRDSVTLPPLD